MMTIHFMTFIFGLLLSLQSYAGPSWLIESDAPAGPSREIRRQWMTNLVGQFELWPIDDFNHFAEDMGGLLSEEVMTLIKRELTRSISPELLGKFGSFYRSINAEKGYFIIATPLVKSSIPQDDLLAIYKYLYRTGYGPPSLKSDSKEALIQDIQSWDLSPDLEAHALNNLIYSKDLYRTPITPAIWRELPLAVRENQIKYYLSTHEVQLETPLLYLDLTDPTHYQDIASTLSGSRPANEILQDILSYVGDHPGQLSLVPLEEFLHPFVKQHLYQYHQDGGPNCFNCARAMTLRHSTEASFDRADTLRVALSKTHKMIPETDDLKMEDVIIFAYPNGEWAHAITYLVGGYVFTKNGISQFSSHQYQTLNTNWTSYTKDERLERVVYRRKERLQQDQKALIKTRCLRVFQSASI